VLREQAEHMDAPDRCSSLNKSSCAAGVVHTWTYNGRIIAQLRWSRGRPRHHVTGTGIAMTFASSRRNGAVARLNSAFLCSSNRRKRLSKVCALRDLTT